MLRLERLSRKLLGRKSFMPFSGRGSAWLERLVRDQEVGGSNPLAPTILLIGLQLFPRVSRPWAPNGGLLNNPQFESR